MDKNLYDRQISEFSNVEIERLKAENERLRAALEGLIENIRDNANTGVGLGPLMKAKEALSGGKG